MTSKLTREWLQHQISAIEAVGITDSNTLAAFKLALAALDSEPVADVVAWSHPTEERTCDIRWRRHDVEPGPLYRHAQQPVVPDERAAFNTWNNDVDCPLAGRDAKSAAWLAWNYRAMLQELQKSAGASNNCKSNEKVQDKSRCGTKAAPELGSLPKNVESRCSNSPAKDANAVKRLTITLPDTGSKAFWSGTGKTEIFLPVAYRRWVKEAIERYCAIALIDVEVK